MKDTQMAVFFRSYPIDLFLTSILLLSYSYRKKINKDKVSDPYA